MSLPLPQNPGIDLQQLTDAEIASIQSISGLGDPGADRILFWDESANAFAYLTAGSGLTITGTTITSAGGVSGTANEIAYFDTTTSIASLAVATYPSLTELSYVKGVTSAIQTQLGTKAPSTAPTFATSITGSYLTASEILITDGSKNIVSAAVATYPSLTELTYLKGVTSALQTQLGGKANTALSNLTSVAINTDLISDTDSTDSIGSTGVRWLKGWFDDMETTNMPTVGGTAILTSLTAPQFTTIELGHATDTTLSRVSAGVVAIEGVNILTTAGGTLTGNITLGENTSIDLDPAGSADGKYSGICITGTAGAALAFGDLIYLAVADSRWELTDADASATGGPVLIGMCVLAAAGDGSATKILLQGQIRADAKFPALTIGAPVYLGETAGAIQVAIPTGADNVIRVVGFALTADEIYFNPSQDHQITVA